MTLAKVYKTEPGDEGYGLDYPAPTAHDSKRFPHVFRAPEAKEEEEEDNDDKENKEDKDIMSYSQPSTLADITVHYRVYVLDDLLAEPREVCYDWYHNLLYVSQRYRQGHAYAPIEAAQEITVLDGATGAVVGAVDLGGWGSGPHGLAFDPASGVCAHVAEGAVYIDTAQRAPYSFVPLDQVMATTTTTSPSTSTSSSSSSSSSSRRRGSGGGGHGENIVAELDLRTGRMRRRVDVPESARPGDGRFIRFDAPAVRFAGRGSRDNFPVVAVDSDPLINALMAQYAAQTIYVTSKSVILI